MEWQDKGVLISTKKFGETSLLATFFSATHGKINGLLKKIESPHLITPLAHLIQIHWQARTVDQLGTLTIEPLHTYSTPASLYTPYLLKNAIIALLNSFLLMHDPYPALYTATHDYLEKNTPHHDQQLRNYFIWEACFFKTLGFEIEEIDLDQPLHLLLSTLNQQWEHMTSHMNQKIPTARFNINGLITYVETQSA